MVMTEAALDKIFSIAVSIKTSLETFRKSSKCCYFYNTKYCNEKNFNLTLKVQK